MESERHWQESERSNGPVHHSSGSASPHSSANLSPSKDYGSQGLLSKAPHSSNALLFITGQLPADFKQKKNMTKVRKRAMGSYLEKEKKAKTEGLTMLRSSRRARMRQEQDDQQPPDHSLFILPGAPIVEPLRVGVTLYEDHSYFNPNSNFFFGLDRSFSMAWLSSLTPSASFTTTSRPQFVPSDYNVDSLGKDVWDSYRAAIRFLYLGEIRTLYGLDGVMKTMQRLHRFNIMASQHTKEFEEWKFRENSKILEWVVVTMALEKIVQRYGTRVLPLATSSNGEGRLERDYGKFEAAISWASAISHLLLTPLKQARSEEKDRADPDVVEVEKFNVSGARKAILEDGNQNVNSERYSQRLFEINLYSPLLSEIYSYSGQSVLSLQDMFDLRRRTVEESFSKKQVHGEIIEPLDSVAVNNALLLQEAKFIAVLGRHRSGWYIAQDLGSGKSAIMPENYVHSENDCGDCHGKAKILSPEDSPTISNAASCVNQTNEANTSVTTCEERYPSLSKSSRSNVDPTELDSLSGDCSTSTEGEEEMSVLAAEKRRVVQRVMDHFHSIFRAASPLSLMSSGRRSERSLSECGQALQDLQPMISDLGTSPNEDTPDQSSPAECRNASSTQKSTIAVPSMKALGKRTAKGGHGWNSDQEDEGSSLKRPKKEGEKSDQKKKQKFACPYFKRNSESYLSRRSCVGPGWDEVRRVKEHLYRNHALSIFCPRCYETFKVESLLHDHQRETIPCEMRPKKVLEGFDKLQEKRLRSRKKVRLDLSEEEKWKDMYRILFPDDNEDEMPSPYMDVNWERTYMHAHAPITDEFARYEQFLRRELPLAVRRELESAVEREFSPLEEKLKSQLVEIVHTLQLRLFQTYTQSRNAEAAEPNNATHGASRDVVHKVSDGLGSMESAACYKAAFIPETTEANVIPEEPTIEERLASFKPPPLLEDGSAYDFDAVLFQFDELNEFYDFEDSAYGSIPTKNGHNDCFGHDHDADNNNGEGSSGTRQISRWF